MKGPTSAELLVQKTREVEQLRALMLANECKDIEELREKLKKMLEVEPG